MAKDHTVYQLNDEKMDRYQKLFLNTDYEVNKLPSYETQIASNLLMTIFRHFDSASVEKGLVGVFPKTGWVIDYPLLERIHYLLVAGFNVFGNAGHQLETRIYMDYLRMEGENNFLSFLPREKRKTIRRQTAHC